MKYTEYNRKMLEAKRRMQNAKKNDETNTRPNGVLSHKIWKIANCVCVRRRNKNLEKYHNIVRYMRCAYIII